MNLRRSLLTSTLVIAAALVAVACSPAADGDGTSDEATMTEAANAADGVDAAALPEVGQRYWAARRQLLAQGFEPVAVADAQTFTVCVAEMEAGELLAGDCPGETLVLPEVEGCAGTGMGNCRTNWRDPRTRRALVVFTTGEPQPGVVSDLQWLDPTAQPAISTEDACRQIVERQYGQVGPAVTFLNGEISWRAPVDGGRLSFACAVDGDQVSLTREGETQTYSLNTSAADAAQEEAP